MSSFFFRRMTGATAVLSLALAAGAATLTWDADPNNLAADDGAGTWNTTGTNWWDGAANTNWDNATPDMAVFGSGGIAGTVTLGEPITVGGLTFNAVSTNAYVITGNTLTLSGAPTLTLNINATIASTLAGAGFTKTGAGRLTLAGVNTYTGDTLIAVGSVTISNASAFGGGAVTLTGGNGNGGYEIQLSGSMTVTNPLAMYGNAGGRAILFSPSGNNVWSGPITVGATNNLVSFTVNAGTLTLSGDIAGDGPHEFVLRGSGGTGSVLGNVNIGALKLSKTDGNTWVVGAPGKTYAWGPTQVSVGTLRMGAPDVLPPSTTVNIGQNDGTSPVLDLNGFDQTVAAITHTPGTGGAKQILNNAGTPATLTVSNNANNLYSGFLRGNLNLTKKGAATLFLSQNNTMSGTIAVAEGVLVLTNGTQAGPLVISNGTTVVAQGGHGLVGQFYDITPRVVATGSPADGGDYNPDFLTLDALNAHLAGYNPALIYQSWAAGTAFNFGATGTGFPGRYNGGSNFEARWVGAFVATNAGSYTFGTANDDGSVIWVDGVKVVENNAYQAYAFTNRRSGSITLSTGLHAIVIGFFQGTSGVGFTGYLTPPGGAETNLFNAQLLSGPGVGSLSGEAGGQLALSNGLFTVVQTADGTFAGSVSGDGGLHKIGTGRLVLSGASTFAGPLDIAGGVLQMDGTLHTAPTTVAGGSTLAGSGVISGSVNVAAGGMVAPGSIGGTGILTVDSLTLAGGATNVIDIGATTNDDLAVVSGLTVSGVVVAINPQVALANGTYTIGHYGTLTGAFGYPVNLNPGVGGLRTLRLDLDTYGEIRLVVTNRGALVWDGTTNANWEVGGTPNWLVSDIGTNDIFQNGDSVSFGDTTGVQTNITVSGTVAPAAITVAAATNGFSLGGAGRISGTTGIAKTNAGLLVIGNSGGNDYTGDVTIDGGILKVATALALGATNGATYVRPGGTLDIGGFSLYSNDHFYVAGTGHAATGAVINSGGQQNNAIRGMTLQGDATIAAWGTRWDFRPPAGLGSVDLAGYTLTKWGGGTIALVDCALTSSGVIDLQSGTLSLTRGTIAGAATLGAASGTVVQLENWSSGTLNIAMALTNSTLRLIGNSFATPAPVSLDGLNGIEVANGITLTLDTAVTGAGGFDKFNRGTLALSAANTYAGLSRVDNGTLRLTTGNDRLPTNGIVSVNGDGGSLSTLDLNSFSQTIGALSGTNVNGSRVTLNGGTLAIAGSGPVTGEYFGIISGAGTVVMNGGVQVLSSSNSFAGGAIVNGGDLRVRHNAALGTNTVVMNGGVLTLDVAGLWGGPVTGAFNLVDANSRWTVERSMTFASATNAGAFGGSNVTWVYTGLLNITNKSPVTWTFAEQFDDSVLLTIDGLVILSNRASATPSKQTMTLAPGRHTFEARFGQGTGAVGPKGGWPHGFSYDPLGRNTLDVSNFVDVVDAGDAGLFLRNDLTFANEITLNAAAAISVPAGRATASGVTGGAGGLIKTGAGTLVLSLLALHGGTTAVDQGELLIEGIHASAGAIGVNTNASLWGTGTVSFAVTTVNGGGTLGPSSTAITGTLTVADLSLAAGAKVAALLNGTNPTVHVTGAFASSSTVAVHLLPLAPAALGSHVLIDYDGTFSGSIADFALVSVPNGSQGYLTNDLVNTSINLVITNLGSGLKWMGSTDDQWNLAGTPNWESLLGATPAAFTLLDDVRFDDTATGNFTVTVAQALSAGTITVTNDAQDFTWTGGAVGGAGGLVKEGAGTLTISEVVFSHAGDNLVKSGTLRLQGLGDLGGNLVNASTVELHSAAGDWAAGNGRTISGAGVLRKTGAGTVSLYNSVVAVSNRIAIEGGLLRNDGNAANWNGSVASMDIAAGAALDLRGDAVQVSALTSAGTITNSLGNNARDNLTVGLNDVSSTFSGVIQDGGNIGTGEDRGAITLVKTGAGTLTLGGVNSYMGNTTLDGGTLAYAVDNPYVKGLVFGAVPNSTNVSILDLSSASVTASGFTNQVNSAVTNLIVIGANRSLTITGNVTVGSASQAAFTAQRIEGNALVVSRPAGVFRVGQGTPSNSWARLDLTGTGYVGINLGTNGAIHVGAGDNTAIRPHDLLLGATNSITAGTLNLGATAQGSMHTIILGSVSNHLNVNTINAGTGSRDRAYMGFGGSGGSIVLRDVLGVGRANVNLSRLTNDGTGYAGVGAIDLRGHASDLLIGTLNIAFAGRNGPTTNTFWFDTGVMDVTGIRMAHLKGTAANVGNLNIGGGVVNIGTNGVIIASNAVGNLSLSGGVVTCSASIGKGENGTGTAIFRLNGASLDLRGFNLGGVTPINQLDLESGTLANVGGVNAGAPWAKTTTGTLVIAGTNLFASPVFVSNGTLLVSGEILGTGGVTVDAGTLGGGGLIAGTVTQNGGSVAPGASAGRLTVLVDYVQNGGTLDLEIAGTTPGSGYDVLAAGGVAGLVGGSLQVTTNGYAPSAGDSFTIVTASNGVSGTFTSVSLPALEAGLGWDLQYAPNAVVLSVTGAPPATAGYDLFAGQIPNAADRGYQNDPDGDGYANLLEYVTGGNPTNADIVAQMKSARTNGVLALKFSRSIAATDATLYVEGSYATTNNATWTGIATNLAGSWGGAPNVSETGGPDPMDVTVADTDPAATNRFLRLRVTRP